MAEINAPRASRLRNLDVRHPEIHSDPRTVCDGCKFLSPPPSSRSSLTHSHPQVPPPQTEVSASLKKEDNGCMPALASHCSSPLGPSSFGPGANAALPVELHAWT